jgi:hypothetical protein
MMSGTNEMEDKPTQFTSTEIDGLIQQQARGSQQHVKSPQPRSHKLGHSKHKYYVPLELRTWYLAFFIVFTLVVFVLLQMAAASAALRQNSSSELNKRQPTGIATAPDTTSSSLQAVTPATNLDGPLNALLGAMGGTATLSTSASTTIPTMIPAPSSYTDFGSNLPEPGAPGPNAFSGFASWGTGYYFVAQYLPTTVAVLYGLLWKCTWFRLKEMEPIYQLSSPMGQYGGWSLYLKYMDWPCIKAAWMAYSLRHWCVLLGAINVGLTTLCTAFAPEVLYIRTTGDCGPTTDGSKCIPHLAIRGPLAWAIGGVVFAAFVVALLLAFKQRKRESKLYAEATSIAGIATLITDPELPRIIAQADSDPYLLERYTLDTLRMVNGREAYGIVGETRPERTATYAYHPAVARHYATPIFLKWPPLALLGILQLGMLILIVYYRYISKIEPGNGFESFMNSESFGVKLLFSIVGLTIRSYWSLLDAHNRAKAPYRALTSASDGWGASADESVCLATKAHAVSALFSKRSWMHPLDGCISLIAVLAEMLVVTLSSVPFSTSTSFTAFNVSVLISTVVLGLMIIFLPILGVRMWRTRNTVPSPQTCLADVIRLLTDRDTQRAFEGLGTVGERRRDRNIKNRADRWGLVKGPDGEWILKAWCGQTRSQ